MAVTGGAGGVILRGRAADANSLDSRRCQGPAVSRIAYRVLSIALLLVAAAQLRAAPAEGKAAPGDKQLGSLWADRSQGRSSRPTAAATPSVTRARNG